MIQPRRRNPLFRRLLQATAFCVSILLVAGCATPPKLEPGSDAMLLVSLRDGSIIQQRIQTDADICMKANDSSLTSCLKRGAPLLDASGQAVIGYEMERTEIQLVGE